MKDLWLKWTGRFNALQARERWLIVLAVLAGIVFVGDSLFIEPARKRALLAERSRISQSEQIKALNDQLLALQSPGNNPDVAAQAELAGLRMQLAEQSARLAVFEQSLVPPQQMASLLEDMIGHKTGLRLISLKTLPATPLLEKKAETKAVAKNEAESEAKPDAAKEAAKPTDVPAEKQAGLFKHGVEITLEGSYAELTAYLERLEQSKSKLLWSSVSLSAENHPKLVLKLTVYSLSLDRTWLIV